MKSSRIDLGMEAIFTALAVALLFTVSSARADETPLGGKVRGVYHQAARGVFIEQSVARAPQGATRWADVDVAGAATRQLVQVPAEMRAELGDRVEFTLVTGWTPMNGRSERAPEQTAVAKRLSSSLAGVF